MSEQSTPNDNLKHFTVLTVNNLVLFPGLAKPLVFRSPASLAAIRSLRSSERVFMVTNKFPEKKMLDIDDLHEVGVIGRLTKIQFMANGSVQALFHGEARGSLASVAYRGTYLTGRVEQLDTRESADSELPLLVDALKNMFAEFVAKDRRGDFNLDLNNVSAGELADSIAALLKVSLDERQQVLATLDTRERVELTYTLLMKEIKQKEFEKNLKTRVEESMSKRQKEYFLNEQMKAIRDEMGADERSMIEEIQEKIEQAGMPDHVREVAEKELKRLKTMGDNTHEATPVRNYLDWLTSVPWDETTEDNLSVHNAREILDEDHYGLDEAKERIIEYIAVLNAVGKIKGSIICLSGPPGVGKTSLGRSIARALGRKFARISLGGVRDEAEIRGHRRTYIGAMPGKIIQTMKKLGSTNPLILLDEVDKLNQFYGGGPTAALLEVLDPEQNSAFSDHYLEVDYDLSNVLFICTANDLSTIPWPLRDRMEIIELSGYTELEKLQIARRHLLPKQMADNGVANEHLKIADARITDVIRGFTREAGVRQLERVLSKICRKVTTERLEKRSKTINVTSLRLARYLGPDRFSHNQIDHRNEPGVVNGLAWTSVGGEILSIEATIMRGTGKVQLTGKLGDVMKESAQAAISYVRTNANLLGIYSKVFKQSDIHIHVPAGGTPKDGPSAGIALACAIVSAFTGVPIHWDVALTGEVTLRGSVLPIGGLKEKLLAARRAHIRKVLIPAENGKDLVKVPGEITRGLEIIQVKHLSEVFPHLLEHLPMEVNDRYMDDKEKHEAEQLIPDDHPGLAGADI